MRNILALMGLVLMTSLIGCTPDGRFNLLRPNDKKVVPSDLGPPPDKEALVAYLNNLSAAIPGVQSDDISLTCYTGGPVGIPIGGKLRAQGPRNFRMTADALGNREVDLGSNNQEFWYWIRQGDKYQVFCSYEAIEKGPIRNMPFPFQPDWVLEAMNMGKYGPAEKYEVVVEEKQLKLIERTKSPQGVPVKKIVVFNRGKSAKRDQPQITDYLLVEEATNKLICSAHITRRQDIGPAELPREMELRWPEQKLKLVLHLNGVRLTNTIPPQVFARTKLNGVPSFNLATGKEEALQHAGGLAGPGIKH